MVFVNHRSTRARMRYALIVGLTFVVCYSALSPEAKPHPGIALKEREVRIEGVNEPDTEDKDEYDNNYYGDKDKSNDDQDDYDNVDQDDQDLDQDDRNDDAKGEGLDADVSIDPQDALDTNDDNDLTQDSDNQDNNDDEGSKEDSVKVDEDKTEGSKVMNVDDIYDGGDDDDDDEAGDEDVPGGDQAEQAEENDDSGSTNEAGDNGEKSEAEDASGENGSSDKVDSDNASHNETIETGEGGQQESESSEGDVNGEDSDGQADKIDDDSENDEENQDAEEETSNVDQNEGEGIENILNDVEKHSDTAENNSEEVNNDGHSSEEKESTEGKTVEGEVETKEEDSDASEESDDNPANKEVDANENNSESKSESTEGGSTTNEAVSQENPTDEEESSENKVPAVENKADESENESESTEGGSLSNESVSQSNNSTDHDVEKRDDGSEDDASVKVYEANWESLDSRPLPSWYDDAKIGIFMHFGPYAVPGLVNEWFWYLWKGDERKHSSKVAKFMADNYPPNWTYQDFGAQLTMEFFNASEFADIVASSGAKYFVFTSKHHDGYCNWPSTYSYSWNSMDVGPKRDVVGELKEAFSRRHPDLHFGLYYSFFEWFHPIYNKDRANNFTTREFVERKMWPELKELVTKYEPHVLWCDGDWLAPTEYWGSTNIRAWLYNESPSKEFIVTNDRLGQGTHMLHGDFFSGPDRYDPGKLQAHKWENAMTLDKSWGHRRNIKIKDVMRMDKLITKVARAVSNGGNILINVGPTKEGTISPIFQERLQDLGAWLKINGEAIYSTRPWTYQNDTRDKNTWYTSKEHHVYAIFLKWPEDDIAKLGAPEVDTDKTHIEILGMEDDYLKFKKLDGGGVEVRLPKLGNLVRECGHGCQWGYVLKFHSLVNA